MKLKYSQIMPLAAALFKHLQTSVSMAAKQKIDNIDIDLFADQIEDNMEDWNPKINKKNIFDEKTKRHCAKFIAGVTLNILR